MGGGGGGKKAKFQKAEAWKGKNTQKYRIASQQKNIKGNLPQGEGTQLREKVEYGLLLQKRNKSSAIFVFKPEALKDAPSRNICTDVGLPMWMWWQSSEGT